MLLRRVIEHVKDQNWTAVALDFMIVVVGVFIGIQVANWNDARLREAEASSARANLVADLEVDQDVFDVRRKFYKEVQEAAIRVERVLSSDERLDLEAQWNFLDDSYTAGAIWPFQPSGQVYNQLLNSGDLSLIGSQAVLRQMRDYYQDAALESGVTFSFSSAFKEHSRGLVGWNIRSHMAVECNAGFDFSPSDIISEDQTYFRDCAPPSDMESEIKEAHERMRESDRLLGDIRFRLTEILLILQFIDYLDGEAVSLIAELETE